LEDI